MFTRDQWLWLSIACVSLLVFGFGLYQNSGDRLGGPISAPKVLWLNFALIAFFLIPAFFAQRHPAFRWVFWSFLIRAVIEGYLLIETNAWRCWMGITHNLVTFVGFIWLWNKDREWQFAPLVAVALLLECAMAWLFSGLANPAEGIYFASDTPMFQSVNRFTWLVVAVVYPWMIWLVLKEWKGGRFGESVSQ